MEISELKERERERAKRLIMLRRRAYDETYKDWKIGDLLVPAYQLHKKNTRAKPMVYLGTELKHVKSYDWEERRYVCSSEGKNARKRRRFKVFSDGEHRDLKKSDLERLVRLNDRINEEEK